MSTDRETDYPRAVGLVLGLGAELPQGMLTDVDWAEALIAAVVEVDRRPGLDEELEWAVGVLLGLGACNPATAIAKLRKRGA